MMEGNIVSSRPQGVSDEEWGDFVRHGLAQREVARGLQEAFDLARRVPESPEKAALIQAINRAKNNFASLPSNSIPLEFR